MNISDDDRGEIVAWAERHLLIEAVWLRAAWHVGKAMLVTSTWLVAC